MALRKALKEGHIHRWRRSTGVSSSSATRRRRFRGALREVLENPAVMTLIADTKAAAEVRALDDFFETLADRPDRALYGPAHVLAAHDMLAIDVLLITDAIFRTRDASESTAVGANGGRGSGRGG